MSGFLLSFHFPSFLDLLRKYVLGACCQHSTFLSTLENTKKEKKMLTKLERQNIYLELYFEQLEN